VGEGDEHAGHGSESVVLDARTREEFGIEVRAVGPDWIERSVTLPAEIRPDQDRVAHIAPRYAGIVREVAAEIGDRVKAGQVLAVVESENLAPFKLQTLLDGVVIEKHITRGEPVAPAGTAFVVADLGNVWVNISVYQRDLPSIAVGQPVVVSAGHGLAPAEGTISYVAPVVNETTRTATARVVLGNSSGVWRPGMFVTARVQIDRVEVPVAVPRQAIHELEGAPVVFVETGDGFRARAVRTGRQGEEIVQIESGLAAGERVVTRGGFTIKSEIQREELSGGHAH